MVLTRDKEAVNNLQDPTIISALRRRDSALGGIDSDEKIGRDRICEERMDFTYSRTTIGQNTSGKS